MKKQKKSIPLTALRWTAVALFLVCCGLTAASTPATAQAFPYQVGFPRTDFNAGVNFSAPTVVDVTGNGRFDVLLADGSGCVYLWDADGQPLPGSPWQTAGACRGTPRINGPLAVGDVNGDGQVEIVAGTRGSSNAPGARGRVFVWNRSGALLSGWPQEMAWNDAYGSGQAEVFSVALANVAGDGRFEIIAGTSNNASSGQDVNQENPDLYAWRGDGGLVDGFPTWYRTAGIYGFVGAANLDNDAYAEVVTGRDHLYMHAYDNNGAPLNQFPVRTYLNPSQTTWGEDAYVTFTRNAPVVADLEGDGVMDIVIAGKVFDPQQGYAITHSALLAFQPDGSRKAGWANGRLGGPPLAAAYEPSQALALADLDSDGMLEIVVAQFDGVLRAYRANGDLLWSYDYAQGRTLFGSEPVIGDVTGDGRLDVIFGTYSPDGSAHGRAALHGVDADGQPLPGFPLPLTHEGNRDKRGIRAAPTLADLDGDCDVEILAGSQGAALYVWDLPALYAPQRMPWPMSRHDLQRSGAYGAPTAGAVTTSAAAWGSSQLYLPLVTQTYCRG